MQAIFTKILPVTNFKPTRILAYSSGGQRLIMSVSKVEHTIGDHSSHSMDEKLHRFVAQSLADSMNWGQLRDCGGSKEGFVFCFPA